MDTCSLLIGRKRPCNLNLCGESKRAAGYGRPEEIRRDRQCPTIFIPPGVVLMPCINVSYVKLFDTISIIY